MSTGYTRAELDALYSAMDESVPPVPTKSAKASARHVVAMRAAGTDRGIIVHVQIRDAEAEMLWLNCWVATELAAAINLASEHYGWDQRDWKPAPHDHLRPPRAEDLSGVSEVLSLSTSGEPGGLTVRFAIAKSKRPMTLFFGVSGALEIRSLVAVAGTEAGWWDDEFALIPSRESQH
jgi:hypothetical protein